MPVSRDVSSVDISALRRAIDISGLSIREFAGVVLVRDQRTIRRWLAGERPIPEVVVGRCSEMITDGAVLVPIATERE